MGEYVPGSRGDTLTRVRPQLKPPVRYRVLMHNDDYTTMEFVVQVLRSVFRKPLPEAVDIMLQIHTNGLGVCGVYTAGVAETKISEVHTLARQEGFPLRCSMEPE